MAAEPTPALQRVKILISGAGTASAVSAIKALRGQAEIAVELYAADSDGSAAGLYLADHGLRLPRLTDPEFLDKTILECKRLGIGIIVPTYSKEIHVFAQARHRFQENGISMLVPNPDSVALANDKLRMNQFAGTCGLKIPRVVIPGEWPGFPYVIKRNQGSGSDGLRIVQNRQTHVHSWDTQREIAQELIEGREFTVDALCDHKSRLIVCSPRERIQVKAGQAVKARTAAAPELAQLVERLLNAMAFVGPCNLQFIQRDADYIFLELNPRLAAGGLMLTVKAGGNIPLLIVKLLLNMKVDPVKVAAGLMMIRYYEELVFPGDQQI